MDVRQIVEQLAVVDEVPEAAIRAAEADRDSVVPVFVHEITQYLEAGAEPPARFALFWIFHLLGQWREKSAYRPLARLVGGPADDVVDILGDAIHRTVHRVMAAVFDGDPEPLYAIIRDADADEMVRGAMFDTLVMATVRGELPRDEAARFLRACWPDLAPRHATFVWDGWQSAIALLGLSELAPLVKRACERGFLDPAWLSFEDFEDDLKRARANPDAPWRNESDYAPFDDTIAELSDWEFVDPDTEADEADLEDDDDLDEPWPEEPLPPEPAVNPFKGVGRNDPCPCGSGRKFKKCCLNVASPAGSPEIWSGGRYRYDALIAPDPDEWLALDEQERIDAAEAYHRRERIRLPNAKVHATVHAIVENQIALGDETPAQRTLDRLMAEGLDRHDAIHAIGSELMMHISALLSGGPDASLDPNDPYFAALERLTAEDWLRSA
jgi:hypothetical protein